MPSTDNKGGYTTVEAVLTVALIAILSGLVMPSFRPVIPFLRSSTTVNQIKKELLLARSRALADPNLHTGVFLDTTGSPDSIVTFFDDDNDNLFAPGVDRLWSTGIAIPNTDTLIIPAGFPDVIIFRGNGSAKTSALFLVKSRHRQTAYDSISVLASTGRIKVSKGTN